MPGHYNEACAFQERWGGNGLSRGKVAPERVGGEVTSRTRLHMAHTLIYTLHMSNIKPHRKPIDREVQGGPEINTMAGLGPNLFPAILARNIRALISLTFGASTTSSTSLGCQMLQTSWLPTQHMSWLLARGVSFMQRIHPRSLFWMAIAMMAIQR